MINEAKRNENYSMFTCPHCGYCQHCGRSNPSFVPYYPSYPNYPYYATIPYNTPTSITTTGQWTYTDSGLSQGLAEYKSKLENLNS